jgi:hypothetical protein
MHNFEENSVLDALIETHLDACCFYRAAAAKADRPHIEHAFYSLEKIHSDIVTDLGIAAYRNGGMPHQSHNRDDGGPENAFSVLRRSLLPLSPVDAMRAAENRCVREMERAIASEALSPDIKMHILSGVMNLEKRRAHLSLLSRFYDMDIARNGFAAPALGLSNITTSKGE